MSGRPYVITSDNTTDLPLSYFEENHVGAMHVDYTIDDVLYDNFDTDLDNKTFYDKIRAGAMPVTQQVNPQRAREKLAEYLSQGFDVLHIAFSSGLSGTYNSVCIAREELQEEYPDAKIVVIDSLCASMGEGLLLHSAVELKKRGKTLDEVAQWVEDNKMRIFHDVVADDLFHLQRGGRVSKATAIMGTALGIKPLIYVNEEGKLISYGKARGKKSALNQMAERLARNIRRSEDDIVFISHSDCLEDAQLLRDMIREKTGIDRFMISYIGPTIGSHTGVGTVALFYYCDGREIR